MATKTARVAMAATAINAFAPRNVGGWLTEGSPAFFIASSQTQYRGFPQWRAGEVMLKKCV